MVKKGDHSVYPSSRAPEVEHRTGWALCSCFSVLKGLISPLCCLSGLTSSLMVHWGSWGHWLCMLPFTEFVGEDRHASCLPFWRRFLGGSCNSSAHITTVGYNDISLARPLGSQLKWVQKVERKCLLGKPAFPICVYTLILLPHPFLPGDTLRIILNYRFNHEPGSFWMAWANQGPCGKFELFNKHICCSWMCNHTVGVKEWLSVTSNLRSVPFCEKTRQPPKLTWFDNSQKPSLTWSKQSRNLLERS